MKSIHTLAFVVSLAVLAGAPVLAQGGVTVPTVQIGARAVSTGYEIDGVIQATVAASGAAVPGNARPACSAGGPC